MNRRSLLRRPAPSLAAALLLIAALYGGSARADGDAGGALETRIYDVDVLVEGHSNWKIDRGPYASRPDQVNDEEIPLFGIEGEDSDRPLGMVGDLIALVTSGTGTGAWEREGVRITGIGADRIEVRAPASLHKEVTALLEGLEREVLTVATVDVVACTGAAPDPAMGFAAAVAGGAIRPLAAARASGFVGERIAAFEGGEEAFLQDYDVEVAVNAKTTDPIVNVQPDGLAFVATVLRASGDVLLTLDAWLARVKALEAKDAGGERIEAPLVDGRTAHAVLRLKPGEWTWASTAGDVTFAVRATVDPFVDPRTRPASLRIPVAEAGGAGGEIRGRRIGAGDLTARFANRRGEAIWLKPSNFTPPQPPELPEPRPAITGDALLELVRTSDVHGWDREGVSLEWKGDVLIARNDDSRLDAIERLCDEMRGRYLAPIVVGSRVVDVPVASLGGWWKDGPAGIDAKTLLTLPGAHDGGGGSLRMVSGSRAAYEGTTVRTYVGDWDVEIAEGVSIGNPQVDEAREGLSLDVRVNRVVGGGAYTCDARLDRSTWRGSRQVPTRHGNIECPSIGLTRFRGNVIVKPGETRIVSAGLVGDEMQFVLLTIGDE